MSVVPSASSRGKRQQVEVEIKLPARKKTRQAAEEDNEDAEEEMMEGRIREAMVEIIERMEADEHADEAEGSEYETDASVEVESGSEMKLGEKEEKK